MDLFTLVGKIILNDDGFSQKIDSAMAKVESMGAGMQRAGEKISSIGSSLTKSLTLPLAAAGTASVHTAASFEDGMLKVQSLSGATQEEYKKLTATAKEYGASTAWTARDVADAMGYMALAGFDTNEILESIGGMLSLASASGEDLATVTDILTDSMTAFGDGASDASRYADVLATTQAKSNTTVGLLGEAFKYVAPLAGSYGYKLEDVSTALGMMANAGVKGSMAGTALSSVITRLGTDTDGCRSVIEEMGIAFYNQDGTARNLSDVMKDLCDKTQGLSVEQQSALAKQIAGMEAQKGLLAIINQGSKAYEELEGKIKSCNGAASEMASNMESGMGGSLRSLKSALEGVSITLGEKLAPYVEKAAEKIKEFTEWFQNLDEKTQDTIVKFGLLVAAAGPVLTVFGKGVSTVGKLVSAGSKLIGGAGKMISVGKMLFSGGAKLAGGIGSLVGKLGSALLPALAAVPAPVWIIIAVIGALVVAGVALYKNWDKVKEFGAKAWKAISGFVGEAAEKIKGFFQGIIDFISNNWQGLLLLLINPVAGGFKLLYDNCETFRNFVNNFFGNLKEGFHNFVTGIREKCTELKENITGTVEGIRSSVVEKWNHIRDKTHELVAGIKEKWSGLRENVSGYAEGIRTTVVEKWNQIRDKTHELVEGIKGKYHEMADNLRQKTDELKTTIVDKYHEIKENAVEKFNELKEKATAKVEELRVQATEKIQNLRDSAVSHFEEIREKTSAKVSEMKEKIVTNFHNMKEETSAKIADLKERWGKKFEEAREKAISETNELKEKATARIEEFREAAVNKVNDFKENTTRKFHEFKEESIAKIHEVAVKGVEGFNTIREKGSAAIENLKTTAASKFTEMGNTIHDKFSGISGKILDTFTKCRETIHDIVEKIKGFFDFEWKLPDIKLPHFSIDGSFSLNPPSIPHIGVDWYAEGGVMTKPTAFGINPATGNIMAGGEAGAEAIAPVSILQDYIRRAVSERDERLNDTLNAIEAVLNRYLPQLAQMQLVLDTGATVGALAGGMNTKLGELSRQDERIK